MDRLELARARFSYAAPLLAVAGAFVGVGQFVHLEQLGAWPPHDLTAHWLAGVHVRDGGQVYTGAVGRYLTFVWAPPWAVIWAVLSLQPRDLAAITNIAAQILALRYLTGSWRGAGLTGWLPFVPQQLVTGNMDLIVAAVVLAGARRRRWAGAAVAVFSFAKFSPAAVLVRAPRRVWAEAIAGAGLAVLVTLPWLHLWPEWIHNMWLSVTASEIQSVPIWPRLIVALPLFLVRRSWATALVAAIATPAFYLHSAVLLLAPLRLWLDYRAGGAGSGAGRRLTLDASGVAKGMTS